MVEQFLRWQWPLSKTLAALRGIGSKLIETLAQEAATRFDSLSLNVHIRNPAVRLYTRTGFRVAAAGRGLFGVAMVRTL